MRDLPKIASKQQPLEIHDGSGGQDPFALALASPNNQDLQMKEEDSYEQMSQMPNENDAFISQRAYDIHGMT